MNTLAYFVTELIIAVNMFLVQFHVQLTYHNHN
jgi:hypothetical protein